MISAKYFSLGLFLIPFAWSASPLSAQANPPVPGTAITEASSLNENDKGAEAEEENLAQVRRRETVSREGFNPNYIGVGLNLGFNGDTALGDVAFAINSRIQLIPNLSFRPGVLIENNAVILVPFTYDFTPQGVSFGGTDLNLIPYVGGGVLFTTDDDSEDDLGALLTAGVDVPVSRQFTANAGLNVGFVNDDAEFGFLLGIGYNIPSN
mgnify:FL=1